MRNLIFFTLITGIISSYAGYYSYTSCRTIYTLKEPVYTQTHVRKKLTVKDLSVTPAVKQKADTKNHKELITASRQATNRQ